MNVVLKRTTLLPPRFAFIRATDAGSKDCHDRGHTHPPEATTNNSKSGRVVDILSPVVTGEWHIKMRVMHTRVETRRITIAGTDPT